jgi:hypothetical protein
MRAGTEEHRAMLAEVEQRRKVMRAEGEDLDKVGLHFDGECSTDAHAFEPISWLLMWQVKIVSESVGRWPTLDELKASAQKMIDATPPETRARGRVVVASSRDRRE